jgi:hypothetical protein
MCDDDSEDFNEPGNVFDEYPDPDEQDETDDEGNDGSWT